MHESARPLAPSTNRARPGAPGGHLVWALVMVAAFTVVVRWLGLDIVMPAAGGTVGGAIVVTVQFGLLWLGLARIARVSLRDLGWRREHWPRQVAIGLAGALVLSGGLVALMTPLGALDPSATLGTIAGYSPGQRLFFAGLGIQAALAEETLFRGYLQGALTRRTGTVLAATITAALFALSHLSLDPIRCLGLLWIGLVLSALRGAGDTAGRSLVAPAVAHAALWALWGDA